MTRRARAQLAYALTRLAMFVAPKETLAERISAYSRIAPGFEHQAQPRRRTAQRPGGLKTTHGTQRRFAG